MSKTIKTLFVVSCFALVSISAQALACGEHADKASETNEAHTQTTETACACDKEKSDKHESCDHHKEHHGEKSHHHKKQDS